METRSARPVELDFVIGGGVARGGRRGFSGPRWGATAGQTAAGGSASSLASDWSRAGERVARVSGGAESTDPSAKSPTERHGAGRPCGAASPSTAYRAGEGRAQVTVGERARKSLSRMAGGRGGASQPRAAAPATSALLFVPPLGGEETPMEPRPPPPVACSGSWTPCSARPSAWIFDDDPRGAHRDRGAGRRRRSRRRVLGSPASPAATVHGP